MKMSIMIWKLFFKRIELEEAVLIEKRVHVGT
jgi:hypothetical protein